MISLDKYFTYHFDMLHVDGVLHPRELIHLLGKVEQVGVLPHTLPVRFEVHNIHLGTCKRKPQDNSQYARCDTKYSLGSVEGTT